MRPTARLATLALSLLLLAVGGATVDVPPAAAEEGQALDEYFKGRIVSMEKGRIKILYDFSDEEQRSDFRDRPPWPAAALATQRMTIEGGRLVLDGNPAARHKAIWRGPVTVRVTVFPKTRADIGGFLSPANGDDDYLTFTLREKTFHRWDGSEGGADSIIKFGEQWKEQDGYTGFRYMARKIPKEELVPQRPTEIEFRLEKGRAYFKTPQHDMKAKELGNKLEDMYVGLYVIGGKSWFDNLVIEGELDPTWLKDEGLAFRTAKPVRPLTGIDEQTEELIKQHKAGKRRAASGLVTILKDVDRSKASHEAAAKALSTGPKRAIHQIIDLLYAGSVEARRYGLQIVKELVGKDFGYKPKGTEKSRSGAIKKIFEEIDKNPDQFQGK